MILEGAKPLQSNGLNLIFKKSTPNRQWALNSPIGVCRKRRGKKLFRVEHQLIPTISDLQCLGATVKMARKIAGIHAMLHAFTFTRCPSPQENCIRIIVIKTSFNYIGKPI